MAQVNKYDRPLATLDYNPLVGYFKVESAALDRTLKNESDARAVRKLLALHRMGVIRLMIGLSTALERQRPGEERNMQALASRLEALGIDREDIFTSPRTIGFIKPSEPGTVLFGIDPDTGFDMETILNQQIHAILFEGKVETNANNIPFEWWRYRDNECRRRGIVDAEKDAIGELDRLRRHTYIPWSPQAPQHMPTPTLDTLSPRRREELAGILREMADDWMNRKNDALGLFNHVTHALNTTVPQHAVFVTSDKNFTKYSNVLKKSNWGRLQELGFPGHILEPDAAVAHFFTVTGATLPGME